MSQNFLVFPNIDGNKVFPPEVRQAIVDSPEMKATFVRFEDEAGNPLQTRSVVIKVNAATGEIIDIIAEA